MTHRKAQIQATLQRDISQILSRDLSDPRIQGMVSITRVQISSDLKQATICISVMPPKYEKRTLHGLNSASRYIHGLLFKRSHTKRVPNLVFELDETLKKQAEVFARIREGIAMENQSHPSDNESSEPQEPQEPTA